jgi:hypothetical protein
MGHDAGSSQRNGNAGVLADVTNIRGQTREKSEKDLGTEAGSAKEVTLRDSGTDTVNKAAISFDARDKYRWRVRTNTPKFSKFLSDDNALCAYFISMSQDIDVAHSDDPHMCVQYVNDIYSHLRESEEHHKPDPAYMERVQKDINATMRGILVDWLVEVAEEYKLSSETLYLSVCYIDRCLSAHQVARTQLQVRHLCRGTLAPFRVPNYH